MRDGGIRIREELAPTVVRIPTADRGHGVRRDLTTAKPSPWFESHTPTEGSNHSTHQPPRDLTVGRERDAVVWHHALGRESGVTCSPR